MDSDWEIEGRGDAKTFVHLLYYYYDNVRYAISADYIISLIW